MSVDDHVTRHVSRQLHGVDVYCKLYMGLTVNFTSDILGLGPIIATLEHT